jgi:PAS domain S-box-containing protein
MDSTPDVNRLDELQTDEPRELRDVRAKLEATTARYISLYDFAPVGYATLDAKGIVHELNVTLCKIIGVERSRAIRKRLDDLVRIEPADALAAHLLRCALRDDETVGELRLRPQTGDVLDVQISTIPVHGEPEIEFRTTFTDITRRKTAEQRLHEITDVESRLRLRYETLDELGVVLGKTLANANMTVEDLHLPIFDLVRRIADADAVALAHCRPDGAPTRVIVSNVGSFSNVPPAILTEAVLEGRTVRKQATLSDVAIELLAIPIAVGERRLGVLCVGSHRPLDAEAQRTLEMIAERTGIALEIARLTTLEQRERSRLGVLARTGKILAVSLDRDRIFHALVDVAIPWFADFCGILSCGRDGLSPVCAVHAEERRRALLSEVFASLRLSRDDPSVLCRAWREERTLIVDRPELHSDDSLALLARHLEPQSMMVVPIPTLRGGTDAIMMFGYAGSRRRYEEDDLPYAVEIAQRAGAALEQASSGIAIRGREDLLAAVSHDLRSPLSAVQLGAGVLATDPGATPDIVRRAESIMRASERMAHLIGDLLDAATIEAGTFTVDPGSASVASLVDELMQAIEPLAAAKSIALACAIDPGLPTLPCDPQRLVRALLNIVDNAVKFAPDGGHVTIAAVRVDANVCFQIANDGAGIAREKIPSLFDRYWRDPESKHRGIGLGLYIAKGIIDAHGGTIRVESGKQGTKFFVTVPAITGNGTPSSEEESAP